MFEEMSELEFAEFLAAFWAEKDWESAVQSNSDGTYLVSGDKDSGSRGLIGVRPGTSTEIDASEVEAFAKFCENKGVTVCVMATRGRFTTDARNVAEERSVHLLDPNELASSVRDEHVEDLVEEFTGDVGSGRLRDRLSELPFTVPSDLPSGVPLIPLLVAIVVIFAALFASGTLASVAPSVDGANSGRDNSGVLITSLSLGNTDNATIVVEWDATQQNKITTDAGKTYKPPSNETFIVVTLSISTTTDSSPAVRASRFALAVNDTNYGTQPLLGVSGTLPVIVDAENETHSFVVFSVPANIKEGTLIVTAGDPGIRLIHSNLEFEVD